MIWQYLLQMLERQDEAVDLTKHFEWRGKIDEASFWWEKYQKRIHGREYYYYNDGSTNTKNHLSLMPGGACEMEN